VLLFKDLHKFKILDHSNVFKLVLYAALQLCGEKRYKKGDTHATGKNSKLHCNCEPNTLWKMMRVLGAKQFLPA